MPKYQFECCVTGYWDGEVEAENKKEALEKAKQDLAFDNLQPDGEINIVRVPKDNDT